MHFFWVLCLCVCNKKDCCVQTLCTQLQIICTLSKLLFQCELLLVFRKSANIILISMWTIINLLEIFQQNDYFLRTIIKVSRVVIPIIEDPLYLVLRIFEKLCHFYSIYSSSNVSTKIYKFRVIFFSNYICKFYEKHYIIIEIVFFFLASDVLNIEHNLVILIIDYCSPLEILLRP